MKNNRISKQNIILFLLLHIMLMGFSLSGVFTKLASGAEFLSMKFILCYGMVIVILGLYAIGWQQIIKRMPLTTAFANKAVTVVWGIIWGMLIFGEKINIGKVIGAIIVIAGVVIYVREDVAHSIDDGVENEILINNKTKKENNNE